MTNKDPLANFSVLRSNTFFSHRLQETKAEGERKDTSLISQSQGDDEVFNHKVQDRPEATETID